mmetsp:Transcript_96348/g.267725  ORF Transcript_96348/g.267725 Transcript_96348/m.267725 type:complete len:340 (+) Transcript_96348:72-1091(+)
MEDARKLLDSLMGTSRDAALEEAKKTKGKNFTADNVCKHYLLGFCPQYELGNSKLTTKRNLGECHKVHSDAMKSEYEAHPDKEKYRTEYEKQFLPFLESQVREADAWVARERANVQKTAAAGAIEKTTINTMPDAVKEQVAELTKDMNKMMASAEDLAEKGDIEGSRFKVELADEIKEKIKDIEDRHPSYTVTLKEEWVCDVCGTRTEAVNEHNTARFKAHFTGKVHLGYEKIREWVKKIRARQRDADVSRSRRDAADDARRRRGSRSRERQGGDRSGAREAADAERRRSRDGDRSSAREADTERRRRRSRSREERSRGGDRDRRRSRSRGEDRGRRRG